jgi:AraC family transcriptional regulator
MDRIASAMARRVLDRHSRLAGTRGDGRRRGGLPSWRLRAACEAMDAADNGRVRLADLAAAAGLSTFHFCRAFRETTGLPPHRWMLARRLERAQDLLLRTTLPVTEVAARVGYDDPGQFARVFRGMVGTNPGGWRNLRGR